MKEKIIKNTKLAENIVNERLRTGDCYVDTLLKYVNVNHWDNILTEDMNGINFENSSSFYYSRCFRYYFFENIDLKGDFFSVKATTEIIRRGYIEFIGLRISAVAPFYIVDKAMYSGTENPLDIVYLDKFKNEDLERKFQSLKATLEKEKLQQVNPDPLKQVLPSVEFEDYGIGEVTYLSYLFD